MAERLKEKLLNEEKIVDIVAGPDAYRDLPNLVNRLENTLLLDFYYKIPKDYQYLLSKDEMD